jgi:hypothetical protein
MVPVAGERSAGAGRRLVERWRSAIANFKHNFGLSKFKQNLSSKFFDLDI